MMCVLNLCLNGLMGEVAWMNSITNKFYGAWAIELHPVHFIPYIRQITEDECYQVLHIRIDESEKIPEPIPDIVTVREYAFQQTLF